MAKDNCGTLVGGLLVLIFTFPFLLGNPKSFSSWLGPTIGIILIYSGWPYRTKKGDKRQVTASSDKHVVVVTTSFPSQETAEEVLATSPNSKARLDAAIALGKTDSPQVVPALAKALLTDQDKYVRAGCAGYLGSIKDAEAEKVLLQAMSDPDPYVRKKIVEALSRIGTEQTRKAIDGALKDADPEVRTEAERYTSKTTKKLEKRHCPFLSESGICEPPGVSDLHECSWETQGRGHHNGCFVYKMHTHSGGPGDFIRRNL